MTSTSKRSGAWISCMQSASMMRSSNATSGNSPATRRATSRKSPSLHFMMFALWLAVTLVRPRRRASSKANRTMRSLPRSLIDLIETPESSRMRRPVVSSTKPISSFTATVPISNSRPVYMPSVFSRTTTRSTLVVHARHTGVQPARANVRVEVERLAQLEVRAAQPARDRRLDRTLERHAVGADRVERLERQRPAGARERARSHRLALPLDRRRRWPRSRGERPRSPPDRCRRRGSA